MTLLWNFATTLKERGLHQNERPSTVVCLEAARALEQRLGCPFQALQRKQRTTGLVSIAVSRVQ